MASVSSTVEFRSKDNRSHKNKHINHSHHLNSPSPSSGISCSISAEQIGIVTSPQPSKAQHRLDRDSLIILLSSIILHSLCQLVVNPTHHIGRLGCQRDCLCPSEILNSPNGTTLLPTLSSPACGTVHLHPVQFVSTKLSQV